MGSLYSELQESPPLGYEGQSSTVIKGYIRTATASHIEEFGVGTKRNDPLLVVPGSSSKSSKAELMSTPLSVTTLGTSPPCICRLFFESLYASGLQNNFVVRSSTVD